MPDAVNEIHGDKVAKQYGFKGGLVPGATVCAYLTHPAVEFYGLDYLNNGHSQVRLRSPLYDGSPFEVRIQRRTSSAYASFLYPVGEESVAEAEIKISETPQQAPVYRGDELGDLKATQLVASRENMEQLHQDGCKAFIDHWTLDHQMANYLRDVSLMAKPFAVDGYANPGFIVGMTNWIMASNVYMNPWILVEAGCQNYAAIPLGSKIIGEMSVVELFVRKGHEFVDANINLFDADDHRCFSALRLRAIYRVRGA